MTRRSTRFFWWYETKYDIRGIYIPIVTLYLVYRASVFVASPPSPPDISQHRIYPNNSMTKSSRYVGVFSGYFHFGAAGLYIQRILPYAPVPV